MPDDLLVYPTEKVVGIAPDRDALSAACDALADLDVGDDRIEIFAGESAEEQLDPHAGSQGPLAKAIRTVQIAMGDEAVRLERLNEAVSAGKYVVTVALSEEDDDARETEKHRIGQGLMGAGAHDVAFYGSWQIQELQAGS